MAEPSVETRLEAAFIMQFANFVTWPEEALKSGNGLAFRIEVVEGPELLAELKRIANGKSAHQRQIEAVEARPDRFPLAGQIVVVKSGSPAATENMLKRLKNCRCLTVTNSDGMAAKGAVINLFRDGNRLRFEVNRRAASDEMLTLSPHLLKLARIVD